jgi:hypothetical protein
MVFNKTPHEILSAVQFRCSNNMTSSSTGVFIIIVIAVLSCTVITLIRLLTFFTLLGLVTSNRQRNAKQFSTEFGRNLESKAPDPNVRIVKLCSLHLHRPQGPTFNLGAKIVEQLKLKPVSCNISQSGSNHPARNMLPTATTANMHQQSTNTENVFRRIQIHQCG